MCAVHEINTPHLRACAGVLARGMLDNPIHIAALGSDPDARGKALYRMFMQAMPLVFRKGVVLGAFSGDTLVGVAGVLPPGRCRTTRAEQARLVPRLLSAVGVVPFARVGRWTAAWAARDIDEPHWHLGPVAVDAHLQGKGIGSALMAEFCARLDREQVPGYLETDKRQNVAFYEKFGFRTIAEAPVLDIPNWFMKR